MKIYSAPENVPTPDFIGKNFKQYNLEVNEYIKLVEKELRKLGYTGELTGKTVSFPVADGKAQYMYADAKTPALIHLPLGDAYQYPHVEFLPKREILKLITREESFIRNVWRHNTGPRPLKER